MDEERSEEGQQELDEQQAEELPDREALSVMNGTPIIGGLLPVDPTTTPPAGEPA